MIFHNYSEFFWKKDEKEKKLRNLFSINKILFSKIPKFMQVLAYESRKGMHYFVKV